MRKIRRNVQMKPKKVAVDLRSESRWIAQQESESESESEMRSIFLPESEMKWEKVKRLFGKAVRAGDIENLCILIERHPYLSQQNLLERNPSYNYKLLHFAAECGSLPLVEKILNIGLEDINVRNSSGTTPLHLAARAGHCKTVFLLIQEGADIYLLNRKGNSVLTEAVRSRQMKLIEFLYKEMFNSEANDHVNACMYFAYMKNFFEATHFFLQNGADSNYMNEKKPMLHIASAKNDYETVRLLIDRGADINAVNASGETALREAVEHKDLRIFKFLIKKGANLTENIFEIALKKENVKAIMILCEKNKDLYGVMISPGISLLHWAAKQGAIKLAERIISMVPDSINAMQNDGMTALHLALRRRHLETAIFLLDEGAFFEENGIEIIYKNYNIAQLYRASRKNDREGMRKYLNACVDPTAEVLQPILTKAMQNDDLEMICLLIEKCPSIKFSIDLNAILKRNYVKVLEVLFPFMNDIEASLKQPVIFERQVINTALYSAVQEQDFDAVKWLIAAYNVNPFFQHVGENKNIFECLATCPCLAIIDLFFEKFPYCQERFFEKNEGLREPYLFFQLDQIRREQNEERFLRFFQALKNEKDWLFSELEVDEKLIFNSVEHKILLAKFFGLKIQFQTHPISNRDDKFLKTLIAYDAFLEKQKDLIFYLRKMLVIEKTGTLNFIVDELSKKLRKHNERLKNKPCFAYLNVLEVGWEVLRNFMETLDVTKKISEHPSYFIALLELDKALVNACYKVHRVEPLTAELKKKTICFIENLQDFIEVFYYDLYKTQDGWQSEHAEYWNAYWCDDVDGMWAHSSYHRSVTLVNVFPEAVDFLYQKTGKHFHSIAEKIKMPLNRLRTISAVSPALDLAIPITPIFDLTKRLERLSMKEHGETIKSLVKLK